MLKPRKIKTKKGNIYCTRMMFEIIHRRSRKEIFVTQVSLADIHNKSWREYTE